MYFEGVKFFKPASNQKIRKSLIYGPYDELLYTIR